MKNQLLSAARVAGRCLFAGLLVAIAVVPMGCSVFGIVAQAIPQTEKAAYPGLAGQKVAILVFPDRAAKMDFPYVALDCTTAIQGKLLLAQEKEKPKELKDMSFPYIPQSSIRFQRDHPELETTAPTEIAPRLGGITRLIFIEILELSTRSERSLQLFRGTLKANLKVVEVTDGKGKMAFEQSDILINFPEKTDKEGMLNGSNEAMYVGVIEIFSKRVAEKFYEHEKDQ